jgi:hypothetical protein
MWLSEHSPTRSAGVLAGVQGIVGSDMACATLARCLTFIAHCLLSARH